MNEEFIRLLQINIASRSVGPSTARRMGPPKTVQAARDFLCKIDLTHFKTRTPETFDSILNATTEQFVTELPRDAQHWGSARKFLNIFLRNTLYNRFLCERYELQALEPWLEVPLDRYVGTSLRSEKGGDSLPRWKTVIGLTPEQSSAYQTFANSVARQKGTYRVHLDLLYWRSTKTANHALQSTVTRFAARGG
jgi:hypothetical protein